MKESKVNENQKMAIISQIAEMSRLLGMIPSDNTIRFSSPVLEQNMLFDEWLQETRNSFMRLSLIIGRELDIQLQ